MQHDQRAAYPPEAPSTAPRLKCQAWKFGVAPSRLGLIGRRRLRPPSFVFHGLHVGLIDLTVLGRRRSGPRSTIEFEFKPREIGDSFFFLPASEKFTRLSFTATVSKRSLFSYCVPRTVGVSPTLPQDLLPSDSFATLHPHKSPESRVQPNKTPRKTRVVSLLYSFFFFVCVICLPSVN